MIRRVLFCEEVPGRGRAGGHLGGTVAGGVLPVSSVRDILCRRQSKTVEEKKKNPLPLYFSGDIL